MEEIKNNYPKLVRLYNDLWTYIDEGKLWNKKFMRAGYFCEDFAVVQTGKRSWPNYNS